MDADDSRPQSPAELIDAGPEVEQFANALDECLSSRLSESDKRERLLSLPRKYHENALRRLDRLRPVRARSAHDDEMDTDEVDGAGQSLGESKAVRQLEKEAQTWDLLRRVLPLRHPSAEGTSQLSRLDKVAERLPGHDSGLRSFFQTNSVAKERRAILQWLQSNAASGPDIDDLTRDLQQSADRGDIIAHGWLHTRSSIKLKKSVTGWPHLLDQQSANISTTHTTPTGAPLVTQLDPDATTRQGRKLQPQDEYFERAIWRGCFEHLRRGSSLQTIRDWCQERTETWRAISMSGMHLSADDGDDDVAADAQPSALALWRRMCFGLARQGGSDDYERAVYGVLAGDILSVEKVARTWDDFLFAHYNALLRTQIDTFILEHCTPGDAANLTQAFPSFDAVQFHSEDAAVDRRLIRFLESQTGIKDDDASDPNKALQASILAREVEDYLYQQGRAMAAAPVERVQGRKYFTLEQHDGLRIVSHVYVLMALLEELESRNLTFPRAVKSPERRASEENILAQYAGFLRRAGLQELIPVYCSILDVPRRYEVLSENLIVEPTTERRVELLNLIKRANIDGAQFVKTQATLLYNSVVRDSAKTFEAKTSFRIIEEGPPTPRFGRRIKADFFGDDPEHVEEAHEKLILALEWLMNVDETWPEVFSFGTKVYKFFLRHVHLCAARALMSRVSFSGVLRDLGVDEESHEVALESVDFWNNLLEQSGIGGTTPEQVLADARNFRELEALVKALDSIETCGAFAAVETDVDMGQRDFWSQVGDCIKGTKEAMELLLKGWLLSGIQGGDEELRELRRAYLPETVLAYVSALHYAGTGLTREWLLESMHLASLVTERQSDLQDTFAEAKRVRELLEAFTACSRALAVATGEKRGGPGTGGKKMREMGWSRDLWSVKS